MGRSLPTTPRRPAIPGPMSQASAGPPSTRARGLMLLVTPKGAKTFYVYRKVEGKPERIKLGHFPAMPVDLARKKAAEILGRLAAGENPAGDRRQLRADPTLAEVFARYMEEHAKPRKRSWEQDQANFDRYLSELGRRQVSRITRAEVRQLHAKLKDRGVYTANRAIWLLRQELIALEAELRKAIADEMPA